MLPYIPQASSLQGGAQGAIQDLRGSWRPLTIADGSVIPDLDVGDYNYCADVSHNGNYALQRGADGYINANPTNNGLLPFTDSFVPRKALGAFHDSLTNFVSTNDGGVLQSRIYPVATVLTASEMAWTNAVVRR